MALTPAQHQAKAEELLAELERKSRTSPSYLANVAEAQLHATLALCPEPSALASILAAPTPKVAEEITSAEAPAAAPETKRPRKPATPKAETAIPAEVTE